jgi:hypothetical protein
MDLNPSYNVNYSELKCINFTVHTARSVLAIKMSLSSLAIVVNLAVIFFIVYIKKARDFVYRLILYLMITDVLQAIAIIIISQPVTVPSDLVPARVKPGWSNACIGSGFASMATLWMGNIVVFWIVLYILWLGWSLYRRVYRKRMPRGRTENERASAHSTRLQRTIICREVLGVFFLFLTPIVIAVIPLFPNRGMYGISGLWCWIKLHNHACGDLGTLPLAFELIFFYVPLMVIVLLVFIFIMAAFICCCRGEVRRHDKNKELKKRYTKEIVIIVAFPLAYCCICLILLINRIYSTVHQTDEEAPFVPLWIAHSVADPVRVVLPALAFLINPWVWKDTRARTLSFPAERPSDRMSDEGDRSSYGSCDMNEYESTLVN